MGITDGGRVWAVRNVLITFDANGTVQRYTAREDRELFENLKTYLKAETRAPDVRTLTNWPVPLEKIDAVIGIYSSGEPPNPAAVGVQLRLVPSGGESLFKGFYTTVPLLVAYAQYANQQTRDERRHGVCSRVSGSHSRQAMPPSP
jgi:hypothetical protein